MHTFCYQNQARIEFGKGVVHRLGPAISKAADLVLFVYGMGSIVHSGLYDDVCAILDRAKINFIEHGGVCPNPVLDHVRKGIDLAKRHRVQAVVAVGGGSVMDSAKAICAGAVVEHDVWQFFRGKKGVKSALPLFAVPTVAGSGSEMNGGMVLTNEERRHKIGIGNRLLQPVASFLDPTLTFTVSALHSSAGAVDIIAHVLEHYLSTRIPYSPLQDRFIASLIATVMESCDEALQNPVDYKARASLLWCSALALSGLPTAGLGWTEFPIHMVEHSLSALFDVPHGIGMAVLIPAFLKMMAGENDGRTAGLLQAMFPLAAGGHSENMYKNIQLMENWLKKTGCPQTLAELGISPRDIPAIAANTSAQANLWRIQQRYSTDTVEKLLYSCC